MSDDQNRPYDAEAAQSRERGPEDFELDRLLQSWEAEPPSPDLERRLLANYRTGRRRPIWSGWGGSIRVPLWMAAAVVALLLLMLPLAVRGLGSYPNSEPSQTRPGADKTYRAEQPSSMASSDGFVTVADMSRLQPVEEVVLRVVRTKEK